MPKEDFEWFSNLDKEVHLSEEDEKALAAAIAAAEGETFLGEME